MKGPWRRATLIVGWLAGWSVVGGCQQDDSAAIRSATPDARLVTHFVVPSTPTAEKVAYLQAIADVHRRADQRTDPEHKISELRRGLAVPVPAGLGEAEVVRLELATRLCETLAQRPEGLAPAVDVLRPMVSPDRSLPVDRTTAQALVTLGDLAHAIGDDALAVGSYARAIRMMSLLRQEIEP